MIKRVKPFWKDHWCDDLKHYMSTYDFWEVGITEELENKIKKICPRKHALVVNSTSNGIWMSLYIWSKIFPERNQVIFPNWGYPATFKACLALGLEPVPVDMNIQTLGMSVMKLQEALSSKTLAVVHIETNGVVGDPDSIKGLLNKEILFIEDAAPSILQDKAGRHGDVSMFSFSPTKPFCVGGGSVILTDNTDLYENLKQMRHTNYQNKDASLNFMMSPYLIALLLPQFHYFKYLFDMRTIIHLHYRRYLNIFSEPIIHSNNHGSIMYMSKRAQDISDELFASEIEHRYKGYPCFIENYNMFPVSYQIRNRLIDLPIHHELTEKDIYSVCRIIHEVEDNA